MFTPCNVYVLVEDVRKAVETAKDNGANEGLVQKALTWIDSKWSRNKTVDVMYVAEFIWSFTAENISDHTGCEVIRIQVCDPNLVPTLNPEEIENKELQDEDCGEPDLKDFI